MTQALDEPRYAVLFKVHYWDDFIERQFRRLCSKSAPGDVFIIADETKGGISQIRYDRVIRLTEAMAVAGGLRHQPEGNLFWYNTDYQLYYFADNLPSYEYIVICEYDCVLNVDVSDLIDYMVVEKAEFVGEPVRTDPLSWPRTTSAAPYYPKDLAFRGQLLCCAAFSREFAARLHKARLHQSLQAVAREREHGTQAVAWASNEAFVGAEIALSRVHAAPLSTFGDVSAYDWAPAVPEFALPALSSCVAVHPVLDQKRCVKALTKLGWKPRSLLDPSSPLATHVSRFDRLGIATMYLAAFVAENDPDAIDALQTYARHGEQREGRLFNVALGKRATQSSVSPWSRHPDADKDACGAIDGQITGTYGFHTQFEHEPWWCVDLEAVHPVREIRIFNRMDLCYRARGLVVGGSSDLMDWKELYRHAGDRDFGGADGHPLVVIFPEPTSLRFIRLHVPREELLHLDEVEIYV